ncbi:MAG: CAP domain-containing protein [Gammaproteobacteria bacterium]
MPSESELKNQILQSHNKFRAAHEASPLLWDSQLAVYASRYANQCLFKHSYGGYGENLAYGYSSASAAVSRWYMEKQEYSYFWPGFSHKTGHFTQVVWKGTKKIGCAYVACNGKNNVSGNYLVCEYSPPGNITNAGYFSANVKKEIFPAK